MQPADLNPHERRVLFGLLAHLAVVDRRISGGELKELEDLGVEMGVAPAELIDEAHGWFETLDDLLEGVARVRKESRTLLYTLLVDLANADGRRAPEEDEVVGRVLASWKSR